MKERFIVTPRDVPALMKGTYDADASRFRVVANFDVYLGWCWFLDQFLVPRFWAHLSKMGHRHEQRLRSKGKSEARICQRPSTGAISTSVGS